MPRRAFPYFMDSMSPFQVRPPPREFPDNTTGFRALHSTVTALLEATDSWAYNIDIGYVNAVVVLDL